jgi:hypothetical protein
MLFFCVALKARPMSALHKPAVHLPRVSDPPKAGKRSPGLRNKKYRVAL